MHTQIIDQPQIVLRMTHKTQACIHEQSTIYISILHNLMHTCTHFKEAHIHIKTLQNHRKHIHKLLMHSLLHKTHTQLSCYILSYRTSHTQVDAHT